MPTGIVRMGGSVGWAFRNQIIEGDQHPIRNNFDGSCAFNIVPRVTVENSILTSLRRLFAGNQGQWLG